MSNLDALWEQPKPPAKKRRRKTSRHDLEGAVVSECLRMLADHPGVAYVERRNTGAIKFAGGGFMRFGAVGAADIWCLVRTPLQIIDNNDFEIARIDEFFLKHIEIECKRRDGKGRQSPAQRDFQDYCSRHKIPYFLVTSADELNQKINEISS